jgi:hypothetical protein
LATLTANNVVLGNGTSNVQFVAPSTTGNLLTSNGTTWTSTAPAAGGTVTSVATGNGLTGGTITTSGTISLDYYTGSDANNTSYPVGSYVVAIGNEVAIARNTSSSLRHSGTTNFSPTSGTLITGTWRARGALVFLSCQNQGNLWQRTA